MTDNETASAGQSGEITPIGRTDPTEIDPAAAYAMPAWASDADVYTGGADDDWDRAQTLTGGANILDTPGGTAINALLDEVTYLRDGAPARAYATLHIDAKDDIPVSLGYRAAAALTLLTRAYETNTPEPTAEQVDRLESTLRGLDVDAPDAREAETPTPDQLKRRYRAKYADVTETAKYRRTLLDLLLDIADAIETRTAR